MHTQETSWQDVPLDLSRKLSAHADGVSMSAMELKQSAAVIESLVTALTQKIHELDSLEHGDG